MYINETQHLTYCLNVHPGEDWDSNFAAIKKYAVEIRRRVSPDKPFGLGMRLSRIAADELIKPERMAEFKSFLQKHDLYVFTINGFPYGVFHGAVVKESVYQPDWTTEERVVYTNLLADILAELLPENVMGSVSSVPGTYVGNINHGKHGKSGENGETLKAEIGHKGGGCLPVIAENIAKSANHLAAVEQAKGKHIILAMEPEPDCLFDSTESTIEFFNEVLAESSCMRNLDFDWRRYIGVCLDTCHMSVVFEDPTESLTRLLASSITVAKVQISAALRAKTGEETAARLTDFAEHVYLHQTRLKREDPSIIDHYLDITAAALTAVAEEKNGEVRVHMHVPLYFEKSGPLRSTVNDLTQEFFRNVSAAEIPHLEIETYTFDVLPTELSNIPIEDSIEREFQVVMDKLNR